VDGPTLEKACPPDPLSPLLDAANWSEWSVLGVKECTGGDVSRNSHFSSVRRYFFRFDDGSPFWGVPLFPILFFLARPDALKGRIFKFSGELGRFPG